jgi:uncharacterized protein YdaU (DUF1376 family)
MPFYTADYTRDTMHLTRDEHGGYILLLIACWNNGGRLLNKPGHLATIARATPAEWKRLAPVLKRFFRVEGRWLVHKRVVAELEKAARLSEARREAGKRGGRPRKPNGKQTESKSKPIANLEGKQNETPARVMVTTTEVRDIHYPSREGAKGDSGLQDHALANVIPLDGRLGR